MTARERHLELQLLKKRRGGSSPAEFGEEQSIYTKHGLGRKEDIK